MTKQKEPKQQDPGSELAVIRKDVVDVVASKIGQFIEKGEMHLPPDYSPHNAMKSAWLVLQETKTGKDTNYKPVLEHCTKDSIANALLNMVVQGLTPAKKQGYFIAYGKQLVFQRSYFGTAAVAKRTLGCLDPWAEVVYEGDEFEYELRQNRKEITKHKQKLENIKPDKIRAAYCVIEFPDQRPTYTEIMTMEQIKKSWQMSKMNPTANDSTHSKYPDQMAKRTVLNRACKLLINATADSDLLLDHFNRTDQAVAEHEIEAEAEQHSNGDIIDVSRGKSSERQR